MYKIKLSKKVIKFLEKHKGEKLIYQFENAKNILNINPYYNTLDISILKGINQMFRLRIGKYRFIYHIKEEDIIIIFIDADSRGSIY